MSFSAARDIIHACRLITLTARSIILTGTPVGTALGRTQEDWDAPGDDFVSDVVPLERLATSLA